MSKDYHIHCATCATTHRFDDANWQEELMRELIEAAPKLAEIAKMKLGGTFWSVEVRTSWGVVDLEWFERHAGHELIPVDEYDPRSWLVDAEGP